MTRLSINRLRDLVEWCESTVSCDVTRTEIQIALRAYISVLEDDASVDNKPIALNVRSATLKEILNLLDPLTRTDRRAVMDAALCLLDLNTPRPS